MWIVGVILLIILALGFIKIATVLIALFGGLGVFLAIDSIVLAIGCIVWVVFIFKKHGDDQHKYKRINKLLVLLVFAYISHAFMEVI